MGQSRLNYRADLDGLRAVAVLGVLLYHLGTGVVPGGFVGVDVFFVLSGFLITRLIFADLRAEQFSFLNFYERRIRRIVPALFFVCACSTAIAATMLLPDELETFASKLVAVAFSVSNIVFSEAPYFAPHASTQPLLHTWSLGIEEQFYILFPILLAAAYRYCRQRIGLVFWLLFAASLATSVALVAFYPRTAFYWIHSRAWELLAGSVIALGLVPQPRERWQREIGSALGLLGIAAAALLYSDATPFPGLAALLPCIGAALVIWAGHETSVAGILSLRPMVFIGLISYSLYLWHWPLIVFARLLIVHPFTPSQQAILGAASLLLAVLTWRFVETPFRRRSGTGFSQRAVFAGGGFALSSLVVCAASLIALKGLPERFSKNVLDIAAASSDSSPLRQQCHFRSSSLQNVYDRSCILGAPVAPKLIVYGDSHGAELSYALGLLAQERHESVRELTASSCSPAMNSDFSKNVVKRVRCSEYNAEMLKKLTTIPPTTILIASNSFKWAHLNREAFMQGLQTALRTLHAAGHRVILLGPVPNHTNEVPVPATLARKAVFGEKPESYIFDPGIAEFLALDKALQTAAESEHVLYVSLAPTFCPSTGCRAYLDGVVMYQDESHISVSGARLIGTKVLAPVLWPSETVVGGIPTESCGTPQAGSAGCHLGQAGGPIVSFGLQ